MREILRRLGGILDRPTKIRVCLALCASLALAVIDAVAIVLMLPLVDLASGVNPRDGGLTSVLWSFFGQPSSKKLTVYVAALTIGLFIIKDIGAMVFTWWQAGFNGRNRVRTSTQIMQHFLTSPYTEISRRSSSELLRTMNDAVARVYNNVLGGSMQIVIQGMTMAAIVGALLFAAPVPTLALVGYFGIAALLYLRVMKPKAMRAGRSAAEAKRAGYQAAFAAMGGIKETQVRSSQAVFADRYEQASKRSIRPEQISNFVSAAPKYLMEILFIVAVGVLLVSTVVTKPSGPESGTVVGLLATFVAAGFRALPAIAGVIASISITRVGLPYLDLVEAEFDLMKKNPASMPDRVNRRMPFEREITVHDVHFQYPGTQTKALNGVTLTLPYGQSLALVGSSGAGKTTLVDTLLGLHRPEVGSVEADGVDIGSDLPAWRSNVGYVPQEVFILDATLAENIAFDQERHEIDNDRLATAIAHAQLDDVVAGLSDGVDTYIGEHGSRLSGGQRQRVGIARALYREPTLLVLDEATSALDNETEHRINSAIEGLSGTVTVVIVAHRLSTARHADQIVFMDQGKVKATGTFEEVRDSDEQFARLVQLGTLA